LVNWSSLVWNGNYNTTYFTLKSYRVF